MNLPRPPAFIVVDTNIVAYRMLNADERLSPLAETLAKRLSAWRLPALWKHEFTNVLATLVRAGRLPLEEASRLLEAALASFSPVETAVPLANALQFSHALGLSAYDSQYVALALELGTLLVTEDKEVLRRAPRGLAVTMEQALRLLD